MTDARDPDPDRLLARAADALRRPAPRDADARDALVRRVRQELSLNGRGGAGRGAPPHRWTLSPAFALLAAAVVFALGAAAGARWGAARRSAAGPAAPAAAAAQRVEFVLAAPGARSVSLVGEFNGWDATATPMRLARDGTWAVSLDLAPGRHVYAFVVDGTSWVPDPEAPIAPEHWFGARNSVVVVPASSRL